MKYTQAQADLIQTTLRQRGLDAMCYFAMRYWKPFTEEVNVKTIFTSNTANEVIVAVLINRI